MVDMVREGTMGGDSSSVGRTDEVVELASSLIRVPSVTNCPDERVDQVWRCAELVVGHLQTSGLELRYFDRGAYPAVLAGFPGGLTAPVSLVGHFDVVLPEPDDSQFLPRVEGEYLWGRGAADMKTVVASFMVWMRHRMALGGPFPPINLLLVGNEENGEMEPFGTPHVLRTMHDETGWTPEMMIVGERTGEHGDEHFTRICTESRGVIRARLTARGQRGHTGVASAQGDLLDCLVVARERCNQAIARHFILESADGWHSAARFPFLVAGEPGVYNITAAEAVLGIEVRPIPEDDARGFVAELHEIADDLDLSCWIEVDEAGVKCPPDNPHLRALVTAVEKISGRAAEIGRKLPGSSARFAPSGNQVVWGQSGVGPHARDERHFIPSIEPYLQVLDELAETLR